MESMRRCRGREVFWRFVSLHFGNSPALQGWEATLRAMKSRRDGRTPKFSEFCRPSGTFSTSSAEPSPEGLGYSHRSHFLGRFFDEGGRFTAGTGCSTGEIAICTSGNACCTGEIPIYTAQNGRRTGENGRFPWVRCHFLRVIDLFRRVIAL